MNTQRLEKTTFVKLNLIHLLQDDNKVKSDEVQSLKTDAVDIKKKIDGQIFHVEC